MILTFKYFCTQYNGVFFYACIAGYTALKPGKGESKRQSKVKQKQQLEKICRSIGVLSKRDVDYTAVGVFRYALVKRGAFFGSTELSRTLRINRLTCLHHLKKMERAGIVKNERGKYALVHPCMEDIVKDFRKNSALVFEEMTQFAKCIDAEMKEHEKGQRQNESAKA